MSAEEEEQERNERTRRLHDVLDIKDSDSRIDDKRALPWYRKANCKGKSWGLQNCWSFRDACPRVTDPVAFQGSGRSS